MFMKESLMTFNVSNSNNDANRVGETGLLLPSHTSHQPEKTLTHQPAVSLPDRKGSIAGSMASGFSKVVCGGLGGVLGGVLGSIVGAGEGIGSFLGGINPRTPDVKIKGPISALIAIAQVGGFVAGAVVFGIIGTVIMGGIGAVKGGYNGSKNGAEAGGKFVDWVGGRSKLADQKIVNEQSREELLMKNGTPSLNNLLQNWKIDYTNSKNEKLEGEVAFNQNDKLFHGTMTCSYQKNDKIHEFTFTGTFKEDGTVTAGVFTEKGKDSRPYVVQYTQDFSEYEETGIDKPQINYTEFKSDQDKIKMLIKEFNKPKMQ